MNIFLHELKAYRKSTILWTFSLTALIVVFMLMFPAFSSDVEALKKALENYPEWLRKSIGMSLDSIFTLIGFYSYIFTYILLCGAIQAMNLGTSIVSKETREKTADFLLTKPVSRKNILTAKLMAIFISLVITNVVYISAASLIAIAVKTSDFSINVYLMISISLLFVQLIFLALGVLVSVLARKIKSVLPISLGTVFGFFIIGMLGSVIGEDAIRYLTPFKYFDSNFIMLNASYEGRFIVIGAAFVIAAVACSYFVYIKKDIHAV